VAAVLKTTVMMPEPGGQCRTFDAIIRPAGSGGDWHTLHGCQELGDVAAMVLDHELIVGIRHRHQTRLVVFDIDAHAAVSPYWHPDGPDHSPGLQRLLAEAEAVGAVPVVYRTPSGGWHVWLVLPEAVHHSAAAAIGQALAGRAGLELAKGQLEVFPSLTGFNETAGPRHWTRSNGFRLPGQQGGATWIGGAVGWCDEPSTAWAEAEAAVELAEGAISPAWSELLEEATGHRRRLAPRSPGAGRHRPHRAHAVEWTGTGESNTNIGLLTTRLYQRGEAPEQLGARVAAAARGCPGFNRYASADTVRRLDAWCLAWATACHRRPPQATAGHRPRSTDPGRNHRLHREAICRLIDAAPRAARDHGAAVFAWSERKVAAFAQVGRNTLRQLLTLWRGRITAALYRPPVASGSDPVPKGGTTAQHHQSPDCSPENESLNPVPPVASRPCRPPPPPPLAMPIAPAKATTPRREHERAELARWLAVNSHSPAPARLNTTAP
jgi:hypothetical protein